MWPIVHSCNILAKYVAIFCFCSKNLPEAKLESYELTILAEEVSRQPNIDYIDWLLVATLVQIYNEKEEREQVKIQNVQVEEKRGIRKWNGAKSFI